MKTNADVARQLDRVGELLELQVANPFRVHAYRHAADALRELDEPVEALLSREGPGVSRPSATARPSRPSSRRSSARDTMASAGKDDGLHE